MPYSKLSGPYIKNNNNIITSHLSHPRAYSSSNTGTTEPPHTDTHMDTLMQDIILLEPINVSTNCNNDSDQSPTVASNYLSNVSILMDTSFTNDTLIEKANNKKKKKLKQNLKTEMVAPTEVVQPHVLTNMLVDVSEHNTVPPDTRTTYDNVSTLSTSIPKEIMDITFNEIVDSPNHSLSFDTHVTVQKAQVAIKKNPYIKNIKAIKHKKEYLKSIKAEESSSNRSQHALSPPLEYTYDGFIIVEDIKLDSSIKNHEELLAFIELFMRQFDHFSSVNFCSTESVSSVIVKFSKHEGLVKTANYFKHGHHTERMKLISKTYYRMGRDKVSCREFKIINVLTDIDLDIVEQAIRSILKGETFYL
ncbi:hypothetical protein C1645_731492 [Glomus cerebriforme]|uniref:Uncharacterized protein n=1 Tax=Glomus cerebriforme TaxID=658196 RepID=A0A397TKU4_9GLOM|nr:hypothetical protein C1645_731492 [Glomus cerebriforme]